jgi:hypothetical protein
MRTEDQLEIVQMFTVAQNGIFIIETSDAWNAMVHKPREGYGHIEEILDKCSEPSWYSYKTEEELRGIKHTLCLLCFK